MKKSALIAGISFAVCLGVNVSAQAAEDPESPPGLTVEQNDQSGDKDLLMFFEEQELVTATKRPTSLRKAPAIATIITADEIRNRGARNLLDVLKMVPGFGVAITEYGSIMLEVRGIMTKTSEKILVMIDGHALNKNMNGSAILYNMAGMLPVDNIKQVEVVRGPGSALYGNSAFVATINVITRNAEEIDGLELKVGGGTSDTWKAGFVGGTAIGDKFKVSGSFDHYKTNGQKLTVEADSLTGTPFSKAPGSPDTGGKRTDAFLKAAYGDLSFVGHFNLQKVPLYIGLASALNDGDRPEQLNYWGELSYNPQIIASLSSTTKLRYDFWEQSGQDKIFPNGFAGSFPNGMIGEPLAKTRTFGIEQQFDWEPFKGNHLIAGASFELMEQYDVKQRANFDPTVFPPTPIYLGPVQDVANWNKDVTRRSWAVYLQDEWQVLEAVSMTAGVRYDHYSDFGDTLNPRVGLVWNFLENADLKLLYGQAFRAPNFVELYDANNPIVLGNASLKPEKITTYEAGVGYQHNRFLGVNLNYFYSLIDDQIAWDTTITPVPKFANIGKTVTQGIELGLDGAITNELFWKANYAWQDPRDDKTGQRLPYVPSHRASGSINYAPVKYLNLNTDIRWIGPRPRPVGDTRAEAPDYATVDLAVTFKNFFQTLEIQAAIHNLFDRRYKDPDTSGAAKLVPGDFPREGISAFVTASYTF